MFSPFHAAVQKCFYIDNKRFRLLPLFLFYLCDRGLTEMKISSVHAASTPDSNPNQGLPDVYFQTKYPILGKYWRALDWKMLIYYVSFKNILRTFGNIL
jgi:hypothetical protein